MNDFTYRNPVRIHFGRDSLAKLPEELLKFGPNVLLVYGGGSIKRTGLYDKVMDALNETGKTVTELSGVMPNPRAEKVYEGIELCKQNSIDFILAVGGGSVIDCSKSIAVGACIEGDFWQTFYLDWTPAEKAIPLGTILTIPATGSEMDMSAVVTNPETNLKNGYDSPMMYPQFSILDPTLTYTLPKNQMVNGVVDTISHLYELYISPPDEECLTDALAEATLRTEIDAARKALVNPEDYDARANMMWCSTFALCGMLNNGKQTDWESHNIEHTLSAVYDVAHGAGLAVVHPAYLRYFHKEAEGRLGRLAVNVWGVNPEGKTAEELALAAVDATGAFFKELGAPSTLTELNIPASAIPQLADLADLSCHGYKTVTREDVVKILESVV